MKGRIKVTGGRGRRRKQLLDNFKKKKRYWQLKGGALDDTVCVELALEEAMDLSEDRERIDDFLA
jgi:hypothetical protein